MDGRDHEGASAPSLSGLLARPMGTLAQTRDELERIGERGGEGLAMGDCLAAARVLARASCALELERAALLESIAVLLAASLSSGSAGSPGSHVRAASLHDVMRSRGGR